MVMTKTNLQTGEAVCCNSVSIVIHAMGMTSIPYLEIPFL